MLGDPGGVGVRGHSGQMDPPGVQLDEDQHLQSPQRGGIDREEVTRQDARGLLVEVRSPGGGGPPRCRVQAVAVQRAADRGCRDPHAEVHQFALDALVLQPHFDGVVCPLRELRSEARHGDRTQAGPRLGGRAGRLCQRIAPRFGRVEVRRRASGFLGGLLSGAEPVSYTHLTLPTNREV